MKNQYFKMKTADCGCVEKIEPLVGPVVVISKRGENADGEAEQVEKIEHFFESGAAGDCLIHDCLTHRVHSMRYHNPGELDYRVRQKWHDRGDCWEWSLEIDSLAGQERELKVELRLPHPVFPGPPGPGHSRWQLWLPDSQQSAGNDYGVRKVHHCKCIDEKTDIPLPLCTLFHHANELSLGLSYLLPPDQTWYTDFEFDQRNWMTTATFNNLGLLENGRIVLKLWLFSHEGDWRCALGWVRNKFPEIFAPVPGQEKLEGNMAYTIPMIPEKRLRDWSLKMNLRWNELFYCRNFGDYFPQEPFNADHFKTPAHPEWAVENLTYDDINRYIDRCHKHNISVMPYFNIGECESEIARRCFPGSIVRIFNGDELVPWVYYDQKNYNILINSDPQYPYFDFVMEQFRKLLDKCPGIDGFFFDQMCYGWIDTAHFDGMTFYNNRPAYNLGNMYLRALKKMRELFPRPRINGMGNSTVRWQMMEYLDGVMAEGDPEMLGRVAMLSPERPTMCLDEGENAFQMALYYGSWLHVSPYYRYPSTDELPEDAVELFSRYNPLFEFLEGRKWVYHANPLSVEIQGGIYRKPLLNPGEKVKANIFQTAFGYAVVIPALKKGMMTGQECLSVKINVPESRRFKHTLIFGPGYNGFYLEPAGHSDDGGIEVKVNNHGAATMILLTEDFDSLAGSRQWSKLSEGRIPASAAAPLRLGAQ